MHLCKADEATFACRPHSSPPVAARRPACRQTARQTWSNATAPPTRPPPPLAAAAQGHSLSDELAKLAEHKEKGIITDEEFAKAKAKALGS